MPTHICRQNYSHNSQFGMLHVVCAQILQQRLLLDQFPGPCKVKLLLSAILTVFFEAVRTCCCMVSIIVAVVTQVVAEGAHQNSKGVQLGSRGGLTETMVQHD